MDGGYSSWNCADLNTTLYSCDFIHNPDWSSGGDFCPLVRPIGFNIMSPYESDIQLARAAQSDFDSGEIKLAYIKASTIQTDTYYYIQVRYVYLGDKIVIKIGFGGGSSYSTDRVYDYSDYVTWPNFRKQIFIMRELIRNSFEYDGMPKYNGRYRFYVIFTGEAEIYTGSWNAPSYPTYPYGHMSYTSAGYGDPSACLLSIPCAIDNEQSRSDQSEGVFRCVFGLDYYTDAADLHLSDANGDYDPDPDTPTKPDPNENDPGGPSSPGGGDGDHRQPYTPIPVPNLPTIGPNSAGFVYMLRLTQAQMAQFAVDLVRPSWWTAIKNFFADPLDFICGIMIVPYQPVSNQNVYPKFGDNVFEHAYPLVYQQYTEIDCGNLPITKYFGGAFDQNPYTELLIWLPYIGYRKLDPDECVGKTINIKYHCDCLTGDCVCYVSTLAGQPALPRVIAQYSGNCGVRVPFGSTSFDAAVAASVQLLGGAVGALAGGALGATIGVTGSSIGASQIGNSIAGSTVAAVNGSKVTSERSGVSGATAGYLSIQYPYLFRTVPNQSLPTNYQNLEGYPANLAGPLTNFSGFAAVETINLNGIEATKEELNEIEALLIGGIYI